VGCFKGSPALEAILKSGGRFCRVVRGAGDFPGWGKEGILKGLRREGRRRGEWTGEMQDDWGGTSLITKVQTNCRGG